MLVSMTEFEIYIFITTDASSLLSFLSFLIKQLAQTIKKVAAFQAHLGPVSTWSLHPFSLIA